MSSTMLEKKLRKRWWLIGLKGLIALAIGILALLQPIEVVLGFTTWIGLLLLVSGMFMAIFVVNNRDSMIYWKSLVFLAVTDMFLGSLFIYLTEQSAITLTLLFGLWLLFTGALIALVGWKYRKEFTAGRSILWNGIIMFLFGLLVVFNPVGGIIALSYLVGLALILFGAALIWLAFQLKGYLPKQIEVL